MSLSTNKIYESWGKDMKNQEQQLQKMAYPTITFASLDIANADKSCIIGEYCNNMSIPLIPKGNEKLLFEQIYCELVDQVVNDFNDVYPQPETLFLIVDDNDGERKYYIGADVQLDDWDGVRTEKSIKQIHPTIKEQAVVELALLKITKPEQFLLKYTRFQIAQRPEIVNKFGFYNDCIDNHGSYRSTWVTDDFKSGILCYIENVEDDNSKIQFQLIGV